MLLILWIVAADLYIYFDIKRLCNNEILRRRLLRVHIVIALLCLFCALTVILVPLKALGSILPVMWTLYALLTIYVSKTVWMLVSLIGRLPFFSRGKTHTIFSKTGLCLGTIIFFVMWWGALVTPRQLEVTEVEIASERIPRGFDGFRIAQFSDAHVGTWGDDTSFIEKLVASINDLHPDVIFFTGDIVNRETGELEPFVEAFSRLSAPDGVYSILGNHDYGDYKVWPSDSDKADNMARLKNLQEGMGWTLLDNTHSFLRSGNDSIALIGVGNWGEPPFHQYGDLRKAYPADSVSGNGLNDGTFKILLSHNPEHWRQEVSKVSNIDLTLSGHTHAMQFMIDLFGYRWSPAEWRYEEWGGLYGKDGRDGEMYIYVNIGCGEVGMPFRIGATPEITLITLHSTK